MPLLAVTTPLLNYNLYWGSIEPDSWEYKGSTYHATMATFPAYQAGSGQDANGIIRGPPVYQRRHAGSDLAGQEPGVGRRDTLDAHGRRGKWDRGHRPGFPLFQRWL